MGTERGREDDGEMVVLASWGATVGDRERRASRRPLWAGIVIGLVAAFALQGFAWLAFNNVHSRPGFMERSAYGEGREVGQDPAWNGVGCEVVAELVYERNYQGRRPPQTVSAFTRGCEAARSDVGAGTTYLVGGGD